MYNYNKLKGKIKEVFGTQEAFAKAVGCSAAYISQVFNGKSFFTQAIIDKAVEVLGIPEDEIGPYFFTKEVHTNETV